MKSWLTALVAGVLFGVGLCVAGMTWPAKVLGFLDIAGSWDPSLAFVMAGAVATYALAYILLSRNGGAGVAPPGQRIDVPLLAGAAIFGVGWGLSGWCPGPVLVSLANLLPQTFVFVGAVIVGMVLARPVSAALR